MTQRVDKDSLPLDKPRRTPGHPTKSHIVKTKVDGQERVIRFGEQGASTAGKPKAGESDRMKQKRASFKARHAKNIAKGKSSPAYWANRVKWAEGGEVEVAQAQPPRSLVKGLLEGIRDWTQSRQPPVAAPAPRPVAPAQPVAAPVVGLAPRDNPYYREAVRLAEKYDLPRDVFVSLVHQESRFNPNLRSPKGAYGLTQLMPGTAKELGVNPRDPMQNLEGGARYLRKQLDTFGTVPLALAAYNAGPGNVRKHDGIPPFRETQNYVREIMSNAGMKPGFAEGGAVSKKDDKIDALVESMRKMFSLDTPKDMTAGETVADIAAGFVPGVGTAQAARDFERARRDNDKLGMTLAGIGMVPVVGGVAKVAKAATKAPDVKEQKMLMGVYRGYAGEAPGETVYHAGAEFTRPNPGLFTHPEREAVQQYQRFTGAPRMHTFEAKPRRTGNDEDVYAMARRLGIYEPGIPAGQYLEQGENAIFPQSRLMVEELHNTGIDSLRLSDGMGKKPSLVALDPEVLRPAQEIFASPQKRVADYYAQKRAAQTGQAPHVEMVLVDPFAGKQYGHSTIGTGKQGPMVTKARKLKPEDVKERNQLYAEGGAVTYDPLAVDSMVEQLLEGSHG
jgi:soluble lytic murein transglycosylase-like protein